MSSITRIKANQRYNQKTYRRFEIKVRKDTESDIIDFLESKPSVNSYLIGLVKNDIKRAE